MDNTAGNKNTFSIYQSVVAQEKSGSTFSNVDRGPRHGPFCRGLQEKASSPPQFQECRRHLAPSGEEVMCLSGTGEIATVFEVNPLTLTVDCNLVTPTIDALRECTTATEVAELEAPDKNGLVTYPGSTSFLPASWLAGAVIAANSSDPFLLITVVNAAVTVFDLEHEEDEN